MSTDNDRFLHIDAAFRAGDLAALREAVGDATLVPNGPMPPEIGSCLEYAIYHSPIGFIRELLELGADPNPTDHDGFPPLIAALSCSRAHPGSPGRPDVLDIIRLLLASGSDPNQRGLNDWAPLHAAVGYGNLDALDVLATGGANPHLRTRIDEGATAREEAERAGLAEFAQNLAELELVHNMRMSEWQSAEHAAAYLQRADRVPHRAVGEAVLLEELPHDLRRVLDLGSGDGRLLRLVLDAHAGATGTAVDFSPAMLQALHSAFDDNARVDVVAHDLEHPLPDLGRFDAVVSSFAIHHLEDPRKQKLYAEIYDALEPGGAFCNLEHVLPGSERSHARFLAAMGIAPGDEDPSNKLLDVRTQLDWLRVIGFVDVDCAWKWRELALLVGRKPAAR